MTYQLICGAEIHVELKTKSGMFCGCKNDAFGAPEPNIYTCPVCLGLPGALPVPNKRAVELTVLLGLALNCEIARESKFDRKHYFYPDLPKGYQISQYDEPLCTKGYIDTTFGRVGITRIHLEEDTATMKHTTVGDKKVSLIDFNRSGTPLAEIVTEPDIKNPEQAKEVLKKIRDIVVAVGASDADMEKGQMRLEANLSLSRDGKLPSYKVEVKNINSFRYFVGAMEYEVKRQSELLDRGETPSQETRGYRADTGVTVAQRSKEEAQDYRYFPEPDIPPIILTEEHINKIKQELVELPEQLKARLVEQGVSESAAKILVANKVMLKFYKDVNPSSADAARALANALVNKKLDSSKTTPQDYLASLAPPSDQLSEAEIKTTIQKVLADNEKVVLDYKGGKQNALGFLVGQVMNMVKGKADPKTINTLLTKML